MTQSRVLGAAQRVLSFSPFDRLLSRVNGSLPPLLQEQMRRVVAQPYSYSAGAERRAIRRGLVWHLSPHDYFQWHQFYRFSDEVLFALLAAAVDVPVIFDVGANIGFYGILMAKAAPERRVFCFEPNPSTADKLRRHRDENAATNVEIVPAAVGSSAGNITLFDQGTGEPGKVSARGPSPGAAATAIDVPLITLDGFVEERGLGPVKLIKADVEGLEPEVLVGAERLIARDRPILCLELTPRWWADRAEQSARAHAILLAQGYEFFHILPAPASPGTLTRLDVRPLLDPQSAKSIPGAYNMLAVPSGTPLPRGMSVR